MTAVGTVDSVRTLVDDTDEVVAFSKTEDDIGRVLCVSWTDSLEETTVETVVVATGVWILTLEEDIGSVLTVSWADAVDGTIDDDSVVEIVCGVVNDERIEGAVVVSVSVTVVSIIVNGVLLTFEIETGPVLVVSWLGVLDETVVASVDAELDAVVASVDVNDAELVVEGSVSFWVLVAVNDDETVVSGTVKEPVLELEIGWVDTLDAITVVEAAEVFVVGGAPVDVNDDVTEVAVIDSVWLLVADTGAVVLVSEIVEDTAWELVAPVDGTLAVTTVDAVVGALEVASVLVDDDNTGDEVSDADVASDDVVVILTFSEVVGAVSVVPWVDALVERTVGDVVVTGEVEMVCDVFNDVVSADGVVDTVSITVDSTVVTGVLMAYAEGTCPVLVVSWVSLLDEAVVAAVTAELECEISLVGVNDEVTEVDARDSVSRLVAATGEVVLVTAIGEDVALELVAPWDDTLDDTAVEDAIEVLKLGIAPVDVNDEVTAVGTVESVRTLVDDTDEVVALLKTEDDIGRVLCVSWTDLLEGTTVETVVVATWVWVLMPEEDIGSVLTVSWADVVDGTIDDESVLAPAVEIVCGVVNDERTEGEVVVSVSVTVVSIIVTWVLLTFEIETGPELVVSWPSVLKGIVVVSVVAELSTEVTVASVVGVVYTSWLNTRYKLKL